MEIDFPTEKLAKEYVDFKNNQDTTKPCDYRAWRLIALPNGHNPREVQIQCSMFAGHAGDHIIDAKQ